MSVTRELKSENLDEIFNFSILDSTRPMAKQLSTETYLAMFIGPILPANRRRTPICYSVVQRVYQIDVVLASSVISSICHIRWLLEQKNKSNATCQQKTQKIHL